MSETTVKLKFGGQGLVTPPVVNEAVPVAPECTPEPETPKDN